MTYITTQLTRDQFRTQVFERDNYKCVVCGDPAKDAHHIIERRLWGQSQGYFIDNGASVCERHHIECETTQISVEDIRLMCGITKIVVPDQLYADHVYDKWGNHILPNGMRTKGELFNDESVQKILTKGGFLGRSSVFSDYVKYPRTYHLPWTGCLPDDDRVIPSLDQFIGQRVIVTEKMDGECVPSTTQVRLANGKSVSIGTLVETDAVGTEILGMDHNGNVISTKITKTYYNGPSTEPWLKLRLTGKRRNMILRCTKQHKLWNGIDWIEAGTMNVGGTCYDVINEEHITTQQFQVLLGKLLGDGSFHTPKRTLSDDYRTAHVQYSHTVKHEEYVNWTKQWIGDLYSNQCIDTHARYSDAVTIKSWTKQNRGVYETFNGLIGSDGVKYFPASWIDKITPLVLAFWYMDDGNLTVSLKQQYRMIISVCGFDDDSCINLHRALLQLGIDNVVHKSKYTYLYINWKGTLKLSELIAPYVCPSMQYKLHPKFRSGDVELPPDTNVWRKRTLRPVIITHISDDLKYRYTGKYDLETECHNYFAGNVLVHNCTSMYQNYFHARSVDSVNHPSRNRVKALHAAFAHDIPTGWRVCAENVYAQHSIQYDQLDSYLYMFSIWDDSNTCLSWDDTVEWSMLLGIPHVPILYDGVYDETKIKSLYNEKTDWDNSEGYVLRLADPFAFSQFKTSVGKYVRRNHVQTNKHWMHGQRITPNKLKSQ